MTPAATSPAPIIALWSELTSWVPTATVALGELPDGWTWRSLKSFCRPYSVKEPVVGSKVYSMVGVRWYGEGLFHRETVRGDEQSAAFLSPLRSGNFIYNRLFAWKESFAVVTDEFVGSYVSNEFPQFEVDDRVASADYLCLLFGTSQVLDTVNRASSGSAAVSRNRYKEDSFLDLRVPVPPISVQVQLVDAWKGAKDKVEQAVRNRNSVLSELDEYLHSRTRSLDECVNGRELVASWASMSAWDVKSGRASAFKTANPDFCVFGDYIAECTDKVHPRTEPETEWPVYGVSNKNGVFLNGRQKGSSFNAPYKRIKEGWFFHNPTRANVGSLGVVPSVPDNALTSPEYQVWRVTKGFADGFVAILIQTEYFRKLISFNRVGAVKQRLYFDNLAQLRLPRVPAEDQERFVSRFIAAGRTIADMEARVVEAKNRLQRIFDALPSQIRP